MQPNRRQFLTVCASLTATSGHAATKPSLRFPTSPRDRLAVSSYPFRRFIDTPRTRARNPQAELMDLKQFPQMVAKRFGIHNVELLGDHIQSKDSDYLAALRAAVQGAGSRVVNIPAGVGASFYDPDSTKRDLAVANGKKWVDTAVALDCPGVRLHIQGAQGVSPDVARASDSLALAAEYGESKNVVITLENDDPATEDAFFIAKVIDKVNSPWLRALPDFCNSMLKGDEKFNYDAVAAMFQRSYNISHVKDAEVDKAKVFRVDLSRTFKIAQAAGYKGYFSMEFEGEGEPYEGTAKLIEESVRILGASHS